MRCFAEEFSGRKGWVVGKTGLAVNAHQSDFKFRHMTADR